MEGVRGSIPLAPTIFRRCRESFIGGAGMTTAVTSMTQLFIDYDAKVNGGYVANVISGGVRVDF